MPDYIPQEIQKKMRGGGNLVSAALPTFSLETDNFALAIHIFQLLMNGTHPFTCRVPKPTASTVAPQPIDNIENGVFPFLNPTKGTDIPKFAPPLSILTNELQSLFRRAFVDGHNNPSARPKPNDFYSALEAMKGKLEGCSKNQNHQFLNTLTDCPWCRVDENMSPKKSPTMPSSGQIPIGGGSVVVPPSPPQTWTPPRKNWWQQASSGARAAVVIVVLGIGAFAIPAITGLFANEDSETIPAYAANNLSPTSPTTNAPTHLNPQVTTSLPQQTTPTHIVTPVPTADYITTANLNLRQLPTTQATSLGVISVGSSIQVTGIVDNGEWFRVLHEGQVGYMASEFLSQVELVEADTMLAQPTPDEVTSTTTPPTELAPPPETISDQITPDTSPPPEIDFDTWTPPTDPAPPTIDFDAWEPPTDPTPPAIDFGD